MNKNPKYSKQTYILSITKLKPNLEKHIKTRLNIQTKKIEGFKGKKERREVKKEYLTKSYLSLILTVPLNQIYHNSIKWWLATLNLKDWCLKRPNQTKLTWGCFVKNSLLIHYFLVNLRFFLWNLYVLKMYHVRLFIVEKKGFGAAPRRCRIHSKLQPFCRKFSFLILLKP